MGCSGYSESTAKFQETILVSQTQGYTNDYRYDLWGNLIYKREAINPSTNWYHESFNSYYNDGLPPGFNSFQETFSQNQGNATDNLWHTSSSGSWIVRNGVYNGTDSTGKLFTTFAWTNSSTSNISIRARVYIAKQINSTALAGIFVHYPGTGTDKWSLDLNIGPNRTLSGAVLQDDGSNNDLSVSSCPAPNSFNPVGAWYTFNLTIQGSYALGLVQADGQTPCQAFTHYFLTGSGPTNFGLQTSGLSVLFDNITATTSTAFITGAGFSNSFIQNGSPSSNIRNAIAATAEFQNVTSGIPPVPLETYYAYNSAGEVTQTRQLSSLPSAQWMTSSRTYDNFGNLLTLTDPRGNTTSYSYSSTYQSAYLTSQTQTLKPGSNQIKSLYGYNSATGTESWSLDPNGHNTTYAYDILGRRTRTIYPNGQGNVSLAYNDSGNYVDITNENGWHTRNIYDGLGRLVVVERFSNGTPYSNESYSYNWMDKTVSQTNPLGKTATCSYDLLGRTTKILEPDGNYTTLAYNEINASVKSVNENGYYKYQYYDRLGRLISVVEQAPFQPPYIDYTTNYYYDEVGNLRQTKDASLQTTRYNYDGLNHLVKTTYPDKTLETLSYDNNGNVVTKIDRKGISTQYSYDSLNRPLPISILANPVLDKTYSYDNNGNILSLGSTNATIAYSYDSRNRIISETYSVNGNFSLSVFPNKVSFFCTPTNCSPTSANTTLAITSINGFSGQISLSYTPTSGGSGGTLLNGTRSVFLPSGKKVQTTLTAYLGTQSGVWNWTITGQSGSSTASTGFMISQYVCYRNCPTSPTGGPTSPSQPLSSPSAPSGSSGVAASYRVAYAYAGELLANITYPDNILIHYAYDGLGRAVNVSRISGVFVTPYVNLAYNKNDQPTYVGYYNGFQSNYTYNNFTYDSLGRTATISFVQPGKKSNLTILSLSYQYNRTGTVAGVTGSVNGLPISEQYQYDPLERLVHSLVVSNGANTTAWYGYDNVGNRLSQNVNTQVTFYNYNVTNNEMTSVQSPNTISYSYDPDGNLISRGVGSPAVWTFTWDAANELLKVADNGLSQGVYAYDAQGRKVESVESSTIFYAYLGTETLYENNTTSKTTTDYIYAAGMRLGKLSGGVVNYYHEDALGSTRLVTDPSGSVVFADGYQPFGQDNGTPSSSQTYRFTGKPVSQATGLYYEYQRWYDPSTGRFISLDPLAGHLADPQSQNGYVYVRNLPTVLVDPTGADFCAYDPVSCQDGMLNTKPLSQEELDRIQNPRLRAMCADTPFPCQGLRSGNEDASGTTGVTGEPGASSGISVTADPTIITVDTNPTSSGSNVEFLDPSTIRFTHDSISPRFQNGKFIPDVAEGLRSGSIDPASVDPIRVVDMNDKLYSLDNRRLAAFQMANVNVPVERVSLSDPAIAAKFADAYTTNWWVDGRWVFIRGWFIWPP